MEFPSIEAGDYSAGETRDLRVSGAFAGERLDAALAALMPEYSRSRLQDWIRAGHVAVDGEVRAEPKCRLVGGERITVRPKSDPRETADVPEKLPLAILYEDDDLIVIDKPAGLVVHPGSGNWSGTLLNALLHHAPELSAVPRAGIVHRLDKDTSGLLVVAKTLPAQTDLVRQLQARTVKREYLAVVRGEVGGPGEVDAPIGRHPTQRTKMAIVETGKPARTRYRVVERFARCTLVECSLDTGRTHQIRVHMASIGHPLVGDPQYGGRGSKAPPGPPFSRQALHARRLGLIHPTDLQPRQWESPLPEDFSALLDELRVS